MTRHTDDPAIQAAYLEFIENVQPPLKRAAFELDQTLVAHPLVNQLDPRRYGVLVRDARDAVAIFRQENVPLETEDEKLGQEYDQLIGAMMVTIGAEAMTIPQAEKLLEAPDRNVRETAWRAVVERRQRDRDAIDRIFDRMVSTRDAMGRNAGFANYRDYMFRRRKRFDYAPEDCSAFHRAVEECCVPLLRRLNERRRRSLGVAELRPWDLAVDEHGRPPLRPFDRIDRLVDGCQNIFDRMDADLGRLFRSLRSGDALDLESRPGKAPGGYQAQRQRSGKPFIFMNAVGTDRDLVTLLHEAGHAFHALLCKDEPLLAYREPPIEFCEVASMGMELLSLKFLEEFYSPDEARRAIDAQLQSIVQRLCWIATIDAFQHWIYLNAGADHAQRTAAWIELFDRFGPRVDWNGLPPFHEFRWQAQLHLFTVPFYYIEYGIAQLGALQLWARSLEDEPGALAGYKQALAVGGARPLPELFEAASLAFNFSPREVGRLIGAVAERLAIAG
jgi:oligoendopeptidase F